MSVFLMLKSWFQETEPGDKDSVLLAECPVCGDAVVYDDGCINCETDFIFEESAENRHDIPEFPENRICKYG